MGEIIQFERGCRGCVNLIQLEKGTFYCTECDWEDGDKVFPVRNGRKTSDWNACEGESYSGRIYKQVSNRRFCE